MADNFLPPVGPPPPKVPEGWKAIWNEQYKEWFYVNTYTRVSQWDKPTSSPVHPSSTEEPLPPLTPVYSSNSSHTNPPLPPETKLSVPAENGAETSMNAAEQRQQDLDSDAKLAVQLQAEENARAGNGIVSEGQKNILSDVTPAAMQMGHAQYGNGVDQENYKRKSGLGRLADKFLGGKHSSSTYGSTGYPSQQQPGYGGIPASGGGYYPSQPQYNNGYYPPQQQYYGDNGSSGGGGGFGSYPFAPPQKRPGGGGGGMGKLGAGALGVGGGLVGGALLANALDHHDDHDERDAYQDGYQDGQHDDDGDDDFGDGGGDGGDFGGGDFGGDF